MAIQSTKERTHMNINTYLTFDGNCEAAMEFYAQCLGGKIAVLHRYAGSPMDNAQLPAEWKNKVMHATLEAEGQRLMASDGGPGHPFKGYSGFAISLNISGDTARAERAFNALAAGGQIQMPYQKTFWATGFGMLTDKFGVPWMVNCER
jgi:PhnB protein